MAQVVVSASFHTNRDRICLGTNFARGFVYVASSYAVLKVCNSRCQSYINLIRLYSRTARYRPLFQCLTCQSATRTISSSQRGWCSTRYPSWNHNVNVVYHAVWRIDFYFVVSIYKDRMTFTIRMNDIDIKHCHECVIRESHCS